MCTTRFLKTKLNKLNNAAAAFLAGTRGAADMVEVPSHTLEHFAAEPRVLSLFARHHSTGELLPPALLQQLEASRQRFVGLNQQQQVRGRVLSAAACLLGWRVCAAAMHAVLNACQ